MYDINWKIGGVGGMGAMGVGAMFTKVMFRSGYYTVDYNEYNSIIKGGHNNFQVRCSSTKIYTVSKKINVLLALDEFSISLCSTLEDDNSYLICDWALVKNKPEFLKPTQIIDIPLSMINKQLGGDEIMKNIVGLGASIAIIGADIDIAKQVVTEQFNRKGEEVIRKNVELLEAGYNYVQEKYLDRVTAFNRVYGLFRKVDMLNPEMVISGGNEGIAIGAVNEGVGYYAAYPMTPASSILHYLAAIGHKYNIVVKHAEDEIAAINSAIGASFGGARSMVGTSGGGFSLMVEGLGLAAITETPIVIAMVSRPGPSTGMPTWTDQGDLRFVLHASQGEFLRIIFTPGDPEECFVLTKLAFELAEKYHIPAIVLSDKYLAESHWSCLYPQNTSSVSKRSGFAPQVALDRIAKYERYADTPSGITPRSIPGMPKGEHLANSDEHDAYGLSNETAEMRLMQLQKRNDKKLKRLVLEMPKMSIYGNKSSKVGIIAFGSVKNPLLEAMKFFTDVKYLHLSCVAPFPEQDVQEFIDSIDKLIVVENNYTGQLAGLIREYTGRKSDLNYRKDDGRPIFYEDIIQFLKDNGHK